MKDDIIAVILVGLFGFWLYSDKKKKQKTPKVIETKEPKIDLDMQKVEGKSKDVESQRQPDGEKHSSQPPTLEEKGLKTNN